MTSLRMIASLLIVLACAGCDPVLTREFDVFLSDRPKVSKWTPTVVKVEGELAEVVRIFNDVAAAWQFEPEHPEIPDPMELGEGRIIGLRTRADPEGAGLSMYCELAKPDRARIHLSRAFATKESTMVRDVRRDLTKRLVDRFGAANVKVTGVWDRNSLRD